MVLLGDQLRYPAPPGIRAHQNRSQAHFRSKSGANSHPICRNHLNQIQITTMNTQISFKTNGTGQCLWTEALPLHELGRLEIHRATNIEFSNGTQHGEVRDRNGRNRFFSRSRSACLEWDQRNLQPD
jgi:hypothetical protein